MWTEHPACMAILWIASQLIIGLLAYQQGRRDERLEYLEESVADTQPSLPMPPVKSSLPGRSIFPVLTRLEKDQAKKGNPHVLDEVVSRTGCSHENAEAAIGAYLDQEPGPETLRSMR